MNVQRALEGAGKGHALQRNKVLNFSKHAPLLVEIAGTLPEIEGFLKEHKPMIEAASGPAILLEGRFVSGVK